MFTVWCDVVITRRQRVHRVFDENGKLSATFQKWGDVMRWLLSHDIRTVRVEATDDSYVMGVEPNITPPSPHPATAPWC